MSSRMVRSTIRFAYYQTGEEHSALSTTFMLEVGGSGDFSSVRHDSSSNMGKSDSIHGLLFAKCIQLSV